MVVFRSEAMRLGTIVLPQDGARQFLHAIGANCRLQILDMNEGLMSRPYRCQIQRVEELQRILRFLIREIEEIGDLSVDDLTRRMEGAAQMDQEAAESFRRGLNSTHRQGDLHSGGVLNRLQSTVGSDEITGFPMFNFEKVESTLQRLHEQFVQFARGNEELKRQRDRTLEEIAVQRVAIEQLRPALGHGSGPFSAFLNPTHSSVAMHAIAPGGSIPSSQQHMARGFRDEGLPPPLDDVTVVNSNSARGSGARRRKVGSSSNDSVSGSRHASPVSSSEAPSHLAENLLGELPPLPPLAAAAFQNQMRSIAFSAVSGVISTADQEKFGRAVFRVTRGNAFVLFQRADEIQENMQGVLSGEAVFVCYFQGARGGVFCERIGCVADAFSARMYPWPGSQEDAKSRVEELSLTLEDREKALKAYEDFFFAEICLLLEPVDSWEPADKSQSVYRSSNITQRKMVRRPLIEEWRRFCAREMEVFSCLNFFQSSGSALRADCWIPAEEEHHLKRTLETTGSRESAGAFLLLYSSLPTGYSPPTSFRPPAFLAPFQTLVDTYGVARYQESNPAPYACAIFPFLFGLMFGDVGHGLILGILALFLLRIKPHNINPKEELLPALHSSRYMILLMSVFAIYAGFLYNEYFGLGLSLFPSGWMPVDHNGQGSTPNIKRVTLRSAGWVYPIGVDPAWKGATNEILFLNSVKMKFSIIVAFLHMSLGLILGCTDSLYFRKYSDFFLVNLPQLLFFVAFIGYLCLLIVVKWLTPEALMHPAPSLISVFIGFTLPHINADEDSVLFQSQGYVESILRAVMVFCVPVMVFGKPFLELYKRKKAAAETRGFIPLNGGADDDTVASFTAEAVERGVGRFAAMDSESSNYSGGRLRMSQGSMNGRDNGMEMGRVSSHNQMSKQRSYYGDSVDNIAKRVNSEYNRRKRGQCISEGGDPDHAGGEGMGDVFLHSLIESIEFLLGSVSNTASYLRLWALSLAHQQLSLVFFDQTIGGFLHSAGNPFYTGIVIALLFPAFAIITIGIMLCMDSLECFLHVLRLQWVEFQGKYYKGDGQQFLPLDLRNISPVA